MKTVKYVTRIILLFIFGICSYSCIGPVPVDVIMIDNELFFVLEEEYEISSVSVASVDREKTGTGDSIKWMWGLGHDLATKVEKRKYPKLQQIKYGQNFEEFPKVIGPFKLQNNVEYSIVIHMGNKFAIETFIITSDNKVIMPHQKVRGEIDNNAQ